jgi:uncharacterized phosphosugar-binding protein
MMLVSDNLSHNPFCRPFLYCQTAVCAPTAACQCEQAEDRAHRIGQKKEVVVLVLVSAGTIEQVILDRAQQKKEIDAKVIQVSYSLSLCACAS